MSLSEDQGLPEDKKNEMILKAQEIVHKMDIASMARYAFIRHSGSYQGMNKMLLFFSPCEELDGASIFTKLSANYNITELYVKQIDSYFIEYLNIKIRNINYYLKKRFKEDRNKENET